ncbi:MAG: PTS sugar transporter subunit IIC/EAL domain-containing protein [Gammaproteobacteria bacterium]|nr:PTS sugar transporter subunit IIC/EAL domain-containing protein [Gammaproteobacteria bacterium]
MQRSLFVLAIQDGFIALAPYLILVSMLFLFGHLTGYLWPDSHVAHLMQNIQPPIRQLSAVIVLFSMAYHFSRRHECNSVVAVSLALSVYGATLLVETPTGSPLFNQSGFIIDFWQLFIPISSVYLLKALSSRTNLSIGDSHQKTYACHIYEYIYTFFIVFAVLASMVFVLKALLSYAFEYYNGVSIGIPDTGSMYLRSLLIQISWFFGIHGPHFYGAIMDKSFLMNEIVTGLTYDSFYKIFAVVGGSGMGLSLLIALLIGSKNESILKISKISIPFVIFNINTLLIYALPIVLNRYFLIPFIGIPLLNISLAMIFITLVPIDFVSMTIPWTTPGVINAWMVSNGSAWLIGFQLFLIYLNTMIYLPFIKKYSNIESSEYHLENFEKNLGLTNKLISHQYINFNKEIYRALNSNVELEKTIQFLSKNNLEVYYQPKVDIDTHTAMDFEALLRIKMPDGSIKGPFFLETIERAGLAEVIDYWVCKEVKKDLKTWKSLGFNPCISINLHPDTLNNTQMVNQLLSLFTHDNVEFEILEKAVTEGDGACQSIQKIIEQGYKVAIDDFGSGYSNYVFLTNFQVSTLKLDKSLIDLITQQRGTYICQHIISLCKEMHIQTVAEGVETAEQVALLKEMGVDRIQGYYFSKAVPAKEVLPFHQQGLNTGFTPP